MNSSIPVYIGDYAVDKLMEYCQEKGFKKFVLVCDTNTYPVLGQAVEGRLQGAGWDVITVRLTGEEIIADAHYLLDVFLKLDRQDRLFLAVGSGTLTDITRFTSFVTKASFVSIPTAASVDGFTSIGAPLVMRGIKKTAISQAPIALFANLSTLCEAPPLLTASGYGDLLGKLLSIADWQLGHVLWGERFDPQIAVEFYQSMSKSIRYAPQIGRRQCDGIEQLMLGLIESGFYMLAFGNSNPASGAEHHCSHFLEMKLLKEGRRAVFHGVKVGVVSVSTAGWYARVRGLSRADAARMLEATPFLSAETQVQNIHQTFGSIADEVIADQKEWIYMTPEALAALKRRVVDQWDVVQEIAARVPPPEEVVELLRASGAPTRYDEIGFSREEFLQALDYGHYLRNRFSINRLRLLLGIPSL